MQRAQGLWINVLFAPSRLQRPTALPAAARELSLDVQDDGCTHPLGGANLARQTSIFLYGAQLIVGKLAHIDQLAVPVRHPAERVVSLLHFNCGSLDLWLSKVALTHSRLRQRMVMHCKVSA